MYQSAPGIPKRRAIAKKTTHQIHEFHQTGPSLWAAAAISGVTPGPDGEEGGGVGDGGVSLGDGSSASLPPGVCFLVVPVRAPGSPDCPAG